MKLEIIKKIIISRSINFIIINVSNILNIKELKESSEKNDELEEFVIRYFKRLINKKINDFKSLSKK